jgi:two-component system response regulator HupR/HoxA
MEIAHTALLVCRDQELVEAADRGLAAAHGYRLVICAGALDAAARLDEVQTNLLLCDLDGAEPEAARRLMDYARVSHPTVARVLVGGACRADAMAGLARDVAAYLYLIKPAPAELLRLVAKRALELGELSRRHRLLSRELKISLDDDLFGRAPEMSVEGGYSQFEKLVYVSPRMAKLVAEAKQAAATDLPVLIFGETGTGKELLARAIQFNSRRMVSPMHVQNCGGMSDEMLQSELFGHVRGAFTGAISDRLGLFRGADGGTVFLDEISEVSPSFQVSLLRFLQEGEVKPLGSDKIHRADVRIIAASNRSLEEMAQGRFRRDLYYRLKGFDLRIPALRERREDIPVLAQFFLEKYAGVVGPRVIGITREALEKLRAYDFPGNVRELETEVRRMVAVADQGGYVSVRHLSETLQRVQARETEPLGWDGGAGGLKEMVERLEKHAVSRALARHHWNQSRAAEDLGLSRVGLANKIRRYGLSGS